MKSPPSSNGNRLVLLILFFGILGSGLTFWNYSSHVFSTNHAVVLNAGGRIQAAFSPSQTARLHPKQQAKVTFKTSIPMSAVNNPQAIWRAEIVTVVKGCVLLQLLEKPGSLIPGEACEVTIDTTIPTD